MKSGTPLRVNSLKLGMPAGKPHNQLWITELMDGMWPKETFAQVCDQAVRRTSWKVCKSTERTVFQMHHRWFWIVWICGKNITWECKLLRKVCICEGIYVQLQLQAMSIASFEKKMSWLLWEKKCVDCFERKMCRLLWLEDEGFSHRSLLLASLPWFRGTWN